MASFIYKLAMVAVLGAASPWLKEHASDAGYVLISALYLAAMLALEFAFKRWRAPKESKGN